MLFLLAAIAIGAPTACFGDVIDLSLSNSNLSTTDGSTVTFFATAFNPNSYLENLNSDNLTIDSPLTVDDSAFLNNWFSISANSFFDTQADALFSVSVPINAQAGVYNGVFDILGGPGLSDLNLLATADFSVTVNSANLTAPEPAAWLLLATLVVLLRLPKARWRRI